MENLLSILTVSLACSAAHADWVGGGMLLNADASAQASSTLGRTISVVELFISFDEADDVLHSIENAAINELHGHLLVQNGLFGAVTDVDGDVNPIAFPAFPETEWDSYVGIGGPYFSESNAEIDDDFGYTGTGVVGGWFDGLGTDGSRQGQGTFDEDSELYLVWAGQFVIDGFVDGRGYLGLNRHFIGSGSMAGFLDIGWIDTQGGGIEYQRNVGVAYPAPGGVVLFSIAGIAASRRRR